MRLPYLSKNEEYGIYNDERASIMNWSGRKIMASDCEIDQWTFFGTKWRVLNSFLFSFRSYGKLIGIFLKCLVRCVSYKILFAFFNFKIYKINFSKMNSNIAEMSPNLVGIRAFELYFPRTYVNQNDLEMVSVYFY